MNPNADERVVWKINWRYRFRMAFHNIIIHPIAGVLWLCGFEGAGDWIHEHL